jgi:hypothetical protein
LISEAFSSVSIWKYKSHLKDHLRALKSDGLLDEEAPPSPSGFVNVNEWVCRPSYMQAWVSNNPLHRAPTLCESNAFESEGKAQLLVQNADIFGERHVRICVKPFAVDAGDEQTPLKDDEQTALKEDRGTPVQNDDWTFPQTGKATHSKDDGLNSSHDEPAPEREESILAEDSQTILPRAILYMRSKLLHTAESVAEMGDALWNVKDVVHDPAAESSALFSELWGIGAALRKISCHSAISLRLFERS